MILEELTNSNSVSHYMFSDFLHQRFNALRPREVNVGVSVSGLSASVSVVDDVLQDVAVGQEFEILYVSFFVSVHVHD